METQRVSQRIRGNTAQVPAGHADHASSAADHPTTVERSAHTSPDTLRISCTSFPEMSTTPTAFLCRPGQTRSLSLISRHFSAAPKALLFLPFQKPLRLFVLFLFSTCSSLNASNTALPTPPKSAHATTAACLWRSRLVTSKATCLRCWSSEST